MTEFLPGDEALREIITPEGRTIREVLIPNLHTGEVDRITTISEVKYDPTTGRPEHITQEILLMGIDGIPITDAKDYAICSECGLPVSKTHSVIDLFCGRVLCLMHTQMIDWNSMVMRVCAGCAKQMEKAMKKARRRQAIKNLLLGRW